MAFCFLGTKIPAAQAGRISMSAIDVSNKGSGVRFARERLTFNRTRRAEAIVAAGGKEGFCLGVVTRRSRLNKIPRVPQNLPPSLSPPGAVSWARLPSWPGKFNPEPFTLDSSGTCHRSKAAALRWSPGSSRCPLGSIFKRLQSPSGGIMSGNSNGFGPFAGVFGAVPGRISKFGVNETMRPLS